MTTHISEITQKLTKPRARIFPDDAVEYSVPKKNVFSTRSYDLTPLDQFRDDHLDREKKQILRKAISKAQAFIDSYEDLPGMSFVITGPVGTGKTTITENILRCFKEVFRPVDLDENPYPDCEPFVTFRGKFMTATELVTLVLEGANLTSYFKNVDCILIDDVGLEHIQYTSEKQNVTSFANRRAYAYSTFLDYIYRRLTASEGAERKHVLINSNIPLVVDQQVNPEFMQIFGERGWSRLVQMSGGFMVDLSGLPDYRPLLLQ